VALLDAVRRSVSDLVAGAPRPPRSVRVRAQGVSIELDFPDAPAPVPTPAGAPNGSGAGGRDPAGRDSAGPGPDGGARERSGRDDGRAWVCAPIVGVFYVAPSPGAAPFVTAGDEVAAGQQVGIVEAMKTMIPVEAPVAGRVIEVLVADGCRVEYGEPLLVLEEPTHADGPDRQPG
jgi:acetyl-CoA carboxylase biotin carboxyl carrier protein